MEFNEQLLAYDQQLQEAYEEVAEERASREDATQALISVQTAVTDIKSEFSSQLSAYQTELGDLESKLAAAQVRASGAFILPFGLQ